MRINWPSMLSLGLVCMFLGYTLVDKYSTLEVLLIGGGLGFVWGLVWPTAEKK